MTYLRHIWARSGLPTPGAVVVHAPSIDWLEAQVADELAELFSGSRIMVNPMGSPEADLHLFVHRGEARLRDLVAWGHRFAASSLAVGFYDVDRRCFEVVPTGQLPRWARGRLVVEITTRARLLFPRAWALWASLYGRCVSSS